MAAALTANLIGALTAGPLVALHFGQVNPWGLVTGIVAAAAVLGAVLRT